MLRLHVATASSRSVHEASLVYWRCRAVRWCTDKTAVPAVGAASTVGTDPAPASSPSAIDVTQAARDALRRHKEGKTSASASSSASDSADRHASAGGVGAAGAAKALPKGLKTKRKAPWGDIQLRDQWSEDAMSRFDSDNFSGRVDSENRYHPEAHLRKYLRWMIYAFAPMVVMTFAASYYALTGRSILTGDFQHFLNVIRSYDTSPRSKLSIKRAEPAHIIPS
jgi:hypothetical protein